MARIIRSIKLSVAALAAVAVSVSVSVSASMAQVQPEEFSFPVGLNPNGDNWLALRSMPSAVEGSRLAKLGPDTLFSEIERAGEWVHVRLLSGDTGWVNARYVSCCRAATGGADAHSPAVVATNSCADLWYQRNAIYKAAGFCFRTARGIGAFGNAGCQYDDEADVPLSARQRAEVADLKREEAYRGCSQ